MMKCLVRYSILLNKQRQWVRRDVVAVLITCINYYIILCILADKYNLRFRVQIYSFIINYVNISFIILPFLLDNLISS